MPPSRVLLPPMPGRRFNNGPSPGEWAKMGLHTGLEPLALSQTALDDGLRRTYAITCSSGEADFQSIAPRPMLRISRVASWQKSRQLGQVVQVCSLRQAGRQASRPSNFTFLALPCPALTFLPFLLRPALPFRPSGLPACLHTCLHTCPHTCLHAYMPPRLHECLPSCLHASMPPTLRASVPPRTLVCQPQFAGHLVTPAGS